MSDKDTLETVDVNAEQEQEQSTQERLEAARKRFEQLKKKKLKRVGVTKPRTSIDTSSNSTTTNSTPFEGTPEVEAGAIDSNTSRPSTTEVSIASSITNAGVGIQTDLPQESHQSHQSPPPPSTATPTNVGVIQLQQEIEQLKITITQQATTIEQQEKTIKKLRDENTDLKLHRMELNEKITELERDNQQLKQLSKSNYQPMPGSFSVPSRQQPASSGYNASIKPAKPMVTRNEYASASQQSLSKFPQTENFREKLMMWKGWQVDMRNWEGSGAQKVAL